MDVTTKFIVEECARSTGQRSSYAAVKDVQIESAMEEYA